MRSIPISRDLPALGVILAATVAVLLIGNHATLPEIQGWYAALNKPSWTPPNWLFGPVWTLLYIMMAAAAWLVWRRRRLFEVRPALLLWATQLVLNLAWSLLFFGQHNLVLGMVDIVALWLTILATIVLFWPIRAVAGVLMLPYVVWVTYAASLNGGILALN